MSKPTKKVAAKVAAKKVNKVAEKKPANKVVAKKRCGGGKKGK